MPLSQALAEFKADSIYLKHLIIAGKLHNAEILTTMDTEKHKYIESMKQMQTMKLKVIGKSNYSVIK